MAQIQHNTPQHLLGEQAAIWQGSSNICQSLRENQWKHRKEAGKKKKKHWRDTARVSRFLSIRANRKMFHLDFFLLRFHQRRCCVAYCVKYRVLFTKSRGSNAIYDLHDAMARKENQLSTYCFVIVCVKDEENWNSVISNIFKRTCRLKMSHFATMSKLYSFAAKTAYTHWPLQCVHLSSCMSSHISQRPITWQQSNAFRHVDMKSQFLFYQEQECGKKKKKSGMVECEIFYRTTISGVYPRHIWVQMSNILTRFKINLFRNSRASSFAVSACRSAFGFKIKWKKKEKKKLLAGAFQDGIRISKSLFSAKNLVIMRFWFGFLCFQNA